MYLLKGLVDNPKLPIQKRHTKANQLRGDIQRNTEN